MCACVWCMMLRFHKNLPLQIIHGERSPILRLDDIEKASFSINHGSPIYLVFPLINVQPLEQVYFEVQDRPDPTSPCLKNMYNAGFRE